MVSRRDVLKLGALGLAGATVPGLLSRPALARALPEPFSRPLAIPPLRTGRLQGGVRIFDLTVRRGRHRFLSGVDTATLGIDADYLGPALRVRRGERVRFAVRNALSTVTTLHWHGVHLPARMDGGPHQVIEPGAVWRPEFEIRQPASLQWYHAHPLHHTGEQVYQGLAGLFYIDDGEAPPGLPAEYGVDDIPLVLQDRRFDSDGQFLYLGMMRDRMFGVHGDVMLVNGVPWPTLAVPRRRMRLRLLNGSNARTYNLVFSDGREMLQVGTDGGLLARPVARRSIRLAPAERADVIVTLAPGDRVTLRHEPLPRRRRGRRGMGMMGMMGMMSMMQPADEPFAIMQFTAERPEPPQAAIPQRLAEVPDWSPRQAARTRRFVLDMAMGPRMMRGDGFTINGRSMDMARIDARVPLGDVEIWEIVNDSPMGHPFHIHDIQFRILDRDGRPPAPWERGLKDTVWVDAGETVRVITRFDDYADPDHPYMFHCHILEHEDGGMMGQFVVV